MLLKTGLLLGIDKLRSQADFTPYEPDSDAPAWLKCIAKSSRDELGTLAVLGPSGISIRAADQGRLRLRPDPASLCIVTLSNSIRGKAKKIAVGIPPLARHFPLLLASAALLASTLERAKGLNRDGGVLVVSRDLDIRSRYCDVFVQKQLLDDAHPGSRMRPNGDRVLLRSQVHGETHEGGVCFFLPEVALPPKIQFSPTLIILDLRYARWARRTDALASWAASLGTTSGILGLYTVGDYDTASALSRAGFLDIPFDHIAIAACQKAFPAQSHQKPSVDCSLSDAPSISSRRHVVIEISGAEQLENIYAQTARLLYEKEATENMDINRGRWILAVLAQLPVPLSWYEFTARDLGRSTLKRLIETLGYKSRHEHGLGPKIQTIRMLLEQLYRTLDVLNPRSVALQKQLELIAAKNPKNPILLLVRDRVTEQAVESWLAVHACPNAEWLRRLDVRGCPVYSEIANRRYDFALVNGAFPRRYRWIAGAALGSEVFFLAYPHEVDIIEKQLLSIFSPQSIEGRSGTRGVSILQIFGAPSQVARQSPDAIAPLMFERPPRRPGSASAGVKAGEGFSGLAGALEAARTAAKIESTSSTAWEFDPGEHLDQIETEADQLANSDEPIASISVEVHSRRNGTGRMFLALSSLVECVRPSEGDQILRIVAEKLKAGDILLRMPDIAVRGTLFDQLVHLAEGQPEMDYLADFRKTWRQGIQKVAAKFRSPSGVDYAAIFRSLKNAGAPIESEQSVRFWVHDLVIGPEAIGSIKAVGQLSGSDALASQAKHFDRAFRKIRGIHQGIGRRLSSAIRESFRHLQFGKMQRGSERLDDRLGIPLDEMLDTIDLSEILTVSANPESVNANIVNRFISTK